MAAEAFQGIAPVVAATPATSSVNVPAVAVREIAARPACVRSAASDQSRSVPGSRPMRSSPWPTSVQGEPAVPVPKARVTLTPAPPTALMAAATWAAVAEREMFAVATSPEPVGTSRRNGAVAARSSASTFHSWSEPAGTSVIASVPPASCDAPARIASGAVSATAA